MNTDLTPTGLQKTRKFYTKRFIVWILIAIVAINAYVLFFSWERWATDEHPYHEAKKYFVVGNLVFFYKKILNFVVKPDNPLMYPFNKAHAYILKKGASLIPESDGEIGMWKYKFDLYFYTRNYYMPNDNTPELVDIASPLRTRILDDMYNTMEILATKPIADKKMNEERLKIFPLIAAYYNTYCPYYSCNKPSISCLFNMLQNARSMERLPVLIAWSRAIEEEWKKNPGVYREIQNKIPQVEMFHKKAIVLLLEQMILHRIFIHKLTCGDPYIEQYAKARRDFLSFLEKPGQAIAKNQIKISRMILNEFHSKELAYLLNKHCGTAFDKEFPDKAWIYNYNGYQFEHFEWRLLETIGKKYDLPLFIVPPLKLASPLKVSVSRVS